MTLRQSGTVSVNGVSMYHEIHGVGPPLVLLHGALGTIESCFAALLPRLAATRQVVAVELQAHGRTQDIDRPLTYEGLASDVSGIVDLLGLERVDLVGYSLGGGVAIEVAMRFPDIVGRVVFAGGPAFSPDGLHPEMTEAFEQQSEESVAQELEDSRWHRAYLDVAPEPEGWHRLVDKVNEFDRNFTGWQPHQLASVSAPVMLIAGDADIVTADHVVEMFKHLGGGEPGDLVPMPASQLAILPGTNHVNVLDRVDWLSSMILAFLPVETEETTTSYTHRLMGDEFGQPLGKAIDLDDLAHTRHSHEFVGAEHGGVPFSVIMVHSAPGVGPKLHQHPYAEVFFVERGEATFRLGQERIVVTAGQVVVGPPNVPHCFTNTGDSELRLTAIHGSAEFITKWLSSVDEEWVSPPSDRGQEGGSG